MYSNLALISFLIDKFVGEFKSIRHPVIIIGDIIKLCERYFYRDSILFGGITTVVTVGVTFIVSFLLQEYLSSLGIVGFILLALLSSTTIASKMLYDSVKGVLEDKDSIKYLVSRDTQDLDDSSIYKASIETYAENLSDGVIAPLFYLLLFGFWGAMTYKAINTLDSMIGYKNERYINYGKVSARLDDIANFIPSRVTAMIIIIVTLNFKDIKSIYIDAKKHSSPNAGYPISAMAYYLGVKLGGKTRYFGKWVDKPYFGRGKEVIEQEDLIRALGIRERVDMFIILSLIVLILL